MKTMPKTTSEEKYRWIKPILDKKITIKNMALASPFSERAIKYWLANYRKKGIDGLENKSRRPKTNSKETPIRTKERIIELRKDNKCCAKKLAWKLEKEGISLHYQTIQKIIKKEVFLKNFFTSNILYKVFSKKNRKVNFSFLTKEL